MSQNLVIYSIVVMSVLNTAGAVGYLWTGRYGMAIVFLGWTVGNIGMIWDAIQMSK